MTAVKITLEQALEIRRRYEAGSAVTSLAAELGISRSVISEVIRGEHPLVRGVANISGRRTAAAGGHTPPINSARRLISDGRGPARLSQRDYRQRRECPVCGARRGEYCTNMIGGGYLRDRKNVHDERRTP